MDFAGIIAVHKFVLLAFAGIPYGNYAERLQLAFKTEYFPDSLHSFLYRGNPDPYAAQSEICRF